MAHNKTTEIQRKQMMVDWIGGMSIVDIAKKYGVTTRWVEMIKQKDMWNKKKEEAVKEYHAEVDEKVKSLSFQNLNNLAMWVFGHLIRELKNIESSTEQSKKATHAEILQCLIQLLKVASELHLAEQYVREIKTNIEQIQITRIR